MARTTTDIRNSFMKEMQKETGLTLARIKEILAASGHTTFVVSKMPTYRAAILAGVRKIEAVKAHFVPLIPPPEDCPIPGCSGKKERQDSRISLFAWKCSEGGEWHCIVWNFANLRAVVEGIEDEEAIKKIATKMLERKKEDAKEVTES